MYISRAHTYKWSLCIALFVTMMTARADTVPEKLLPAIVEVIATDKNGGNAIGTGFYVEGGRLLTAFHVIQDAEKIRILRSDGSNYTASVVSYDAARDIAVLSLPTASVVKVKLVVGDLPIELTSMSGLVLGNPDLKKNFAMKVSFPRDSTIKATQWLAPGGDKGSLFQFKTVDLDLIVMDGTLNRGMSGGPLIVGEKVIGLFSGGEQTSGGGLAWAIPLKYLQNLTLNDKGLPASQLPRLSMLGRGQAAIVPLKRTTFQGSGKMMEASLQIAGTMSEIDMALESIGAALKLLDAVCREHVDTKLLEQFGLSEAETGDLEKDHWTKCASIFMNINSNSPGELKYVENIKKISPVIDQLAKQNADFKRSMTSEAEEQMLYLRAKDITSGYFQNLQETMVDCDLDFLIIKSAVHKFVDDSRPFNTRLDLIVDQIRAGAFDVGSPAKFSFEKFGEYKDLRELGANLPVVRQRLGAFRDANTAVREKFAQCTAAMITILESRNTQFLDAKSRSLSELKPVELGYVGGTIFGAYLMADTMFSACEKREIPEQQFMRDYHARWRADWFAVYKKSLDLLKDNGMSDAEVQSMRSDILNLVSAPLALLGHAGMTNCAAINSEKIPLIDSLSYNTRVREFAELLDVTLPDAPPPDKHGSEKLRSMLEPALSSFYSKKLLSGGKITATGMSKLIDGFRVVGLSDVLDRQRDQCREWFPEIADSITVQIQRWHETNAAALGRGLADFRSALAEFSPNESSLALATTEKQIRERMSIELLQALQHEVGMDARTSKTVCEEMVKRIHSLRLGI